MQTKEGVSQHKLSLLSIRIPGVFSIKSDTVIFSKYLAGVKDIFCTGLFRFFGECRQSKKQWRH